MKRRTGRRGLVALVGLAALAAACTPVTGDPPATTTTTTLAPPSATCTNQAEPTPTPQTPVDYVAVVDTPGAAQPEVVTFTATSLGDKDAQVADLTEGGTLLAVEPDGEVAAAVDTTADDNYAQQWFLPKAGFDVAWGTYDGTGVRIAIVDSGVRATHEDFSEPAGKVAPGRDFVADPAGVPGGNTDPYGHGTHVAGIAAASDNTVAPGGGLGGAPGATIVPVRVLNSAGSGPYSAVADGIIWAASATGGDADVVNLSLGGAGCSSSIGVAVASAQADGAIVVAAAGNGNTNTAFSPAGFDNEVIAVAATDTNDQKAAYSNFGPYVDIAAPGGTPPPPPPPPPSATSILSASSTADDAYTTKSGTSMASPLVAAAVALYLQKCGTTSFADVRQKVIDSATVVVPGFAFKRLDAGALVAQPCS